MSQKERRRRHLLKMVVEGRISLIEAGLRPTQVGQALETLGIKAVFAHTPQAKGRVERAFGALQDRLLAQFDLHSITDLDRIISLSYPATVANDNTVRQHGLVIDIPPGPKGLSYAEAHVGLRPLLGGTWRVYYEKPGHRLPPPNK